MAPRGVEEGPALDLFVTSKPCIVRQKWLNKRLVDDHP
jgi:hypothetical protein